MEPLVSTIRELIDRAADERPGAAFLIAPETGREIDFEALRAGSRRLTQRLQGLGLRSGDRVGLAIENGPRAAELLLGAMYAGFTPVMLHTTAGPDRFAASLDHCRAKIVLSSETKLEAICRAAGDTTRAVRVVVDLGQDEEDENVGAAERLPAPASVDDALLVYTSGTTSRPRGALFDHRRVLACAENTARSHRLAPVDRFLCVLPLAHMNSIDKLLGTLWSGGGVVLPGRFDVDRFWSWVDEYACSWSALVPTLVVQLLARADRESPEAVDHSAMRFMRCSSAPLSAELLNGFESRFGIPLLEGMGMTEAGSVFLNPFPPGVRKSGSVGVAHAGIEVRILGETGRVRSEGDARYPDDAGDADDADDADGARDREDADDGGRVGEIAVRGRCVMRGYDLEPEATAEAIDAAGWLRTGDLGRLDTDGYLFVVGRSKEILIKGGVNIAPREIDEVLEAHPAVLEAASVGVPDSLLGEDIVAVVVLRDRASATERELLEHCVERLGDFRTPRRIDFSRSLPRGPSGKVQRLRLRERAEQLLVGPSAPASGGSSPERREQQMATVWSELLDVSTVGPDDDFFELGGDSLLALAVLARLRAELGIDLSAASFFENPTLGQQAVLLPAAAPSRQRSAILLAPVRTRSSNPPLFCLYGPLQYRALARRLGPRQPTYGVFASREVEFVSGESEIPSSTVEDLAERYLEELRSVQPCGPYHLAGFSFGGRVALEVAQRLVGDGEVVALLAIFDTGLAKPRRDPMAWLAHRIGPDRVRLSQAMDRLRAWRRRAPLTVAEPTRKPRMWQAADKRESELRAWARGRYVARPYSGRIVLFRARDQSLRPGYRIEPDLGWRQVAQGGLDVHVVPGDHLGILKEPHVSALAEILRRYLDGDGGFQPERA